MLWLQTPPWGRWIAAGCLVVAAAWVELSPEAHQDHPFSTETIAAGVEISELNTEMRSVPRGLLPPVELGSVARREVSAGIPVLPDDTTDSDAPLPTGWWIVAVELPPQVATGETVRMVLLDTGETIDGVVASQSSEDTFGVVTGGVAVPPEASGLVAAAVASGRAAVLVSTG